MKLLPDDVQPIPSTPGYFASASGDVWSTRRNTSEPCRLKYATGTKGYFQVCVRLNKKQHHRYVHRLIAETFIGPKPFSNAQINHKNGNKKDNRASNLEWVSCLQNEIHALRNGLIPSVLTEADVRDVRELRSRGLLLKEIAAMKGTTPCVIHNAVKRKTWSHVI